MLNQRTLLTPHQRRHEKTFTGCWTCRARKIKCDESRPGCGQCRLRRIECEGYSVRLQWVTPETGHGGVADAAPSLLYPTMSHRSRVTAGPSLPMLQWHEIDEIMYALDTLSPSHLKNPNPNDQNLRLMQCFGVFDSTEARDASPAQDRQPAQPNNIFPSPNNSSSDEGGSHSFSIGNESVHPFFEHGDPISMSSLPLPEPIITDNLDNDFSLAFSQFDQEPLLFHQDTDPISDIEVLPPKEPDPVVQHFWGNSPNEVIPRSPPPPSGLPSQERYLMHHYINRVVHLFVALDNPKSPWQTIHLPRALQGAGELVVQGTTSAAKNALRYCLLSISAFCLSNDHRRELSHGEAQKWAREGASFRSKAIRHLNQAVSGNLSKESRPKYKECLATMLSMISINVMSGDTDTCGLHLDGAFKLISHSKKWKNKYSLKAQALHRTYFFLRTIYESTQIGQQSSNSYTQGSTDSTASILPVPGRANTTTESANISAFSPPPSPPMGSALSNSSPFLESEGGNDLCASTYVYGVPHSLLVLLNKAIPVVNQVLHERARTGQRILPPNLASQCDKMEASIMEWDIESMPYPVLSANSESNSKIITLMTRAFHNGLIIYFAQHVRLLGHHWLQPYLRNVIDSLESIEAIKGETSILATPIYWPAFIAASEAFDPALQERFRRWYGQVGVYGIGSVKTGISVLSEVWDQGPCTGATLTSIWRMVVERTGAVLLLS